jgi:2-polyprenyl-6-hydroxyphenyl methylase/3-demethylubiquinone-9 3-methyltransferase
MTKHEGCDRPRAPRRVEAFEFGRNWQRYIESYLESDRVDIAARSLDDLLGSDLSGKVFLDIGAGSGLFSLCAYKAGAARVISVDVDPHSADACRTLRKSVGDPKNWEILEGSILDLEFVSTLPRADIVYSWGVLHHTGDMYTALRNAATLVAPAGLLCIAIYNRVTARFLDSRRWWKIKHRYNHSPRRVQRAMEIAHFVYWIARQLSARRNPLRVAADYKRSRGMALSTDLIDWLGGYPYEYATAEEIVSFCRAECGLEELKVIRTGTRDIGNNEFVFRPLHQN